MSEVAEGKLGVVRVGVIPTVAAYFLPAVLKEFKSRYPTVKVLLREEGRTPLLDPLLDSHEIDLSIALEQPTSKGLKSSRLMVEEFCIAVSTQNPLSALTRAPITKFRSEPFILYKTAGHNNRELALQCCRNAGFEPQVAFESEQAQTILNLVASNLGVTLLPHMVLQQRRGQNLAMVRIEPPTPKRTIVAAWKAGRYLSMSARQFLQCCDVIARTLRPADAKPR
jgi:DNA-binding transcriptional LysR family regulator